MIRHCADCGAPFSLEPEEEDWYQREGLTVPKRCTRCRALRKGTRDRYLTCRFCGRTFTYPRELQLYARTYGWGEPRRCIGGCEGGGGEPETGEERAMRELLERLRDRRDHRDTPPIEAALDSRPRGPRRAPGGPSPDDLFKGLGGEGAGGEDQTALAGDVERFREQRSAPEQLFSGLDGGPGRSGTGGSKKRRRRKKRRPKPRH